MTSPASAPFRWSRDRRDHLISQADVQLTQLAGVDPARCARHEVGAPGRLGEGDAVADVGQAGVEHHQPVEPEGDAAVRRGTVAKGAEQEAELLLGLLGGQSQEAEDLRLDRRVVAADRAAGGFLAVDDEVVGLGADLAPGRSRAGEGLRAGAS